MKYLDKTEHRLDNFAIGIMGMPQNMLHVKSFQIGVFPGAYFSVFRLNTEISSNLRSKSPYSFRMQENTDQKKLRIWTLFAQCVFLGPPLSNASVWIFRAQPEQHACFLLRKIPKKIILRKHDFFAIPLIYRDVKYYMGSPI